LDLLKGFEAAARHLSFTHAAQELSLTQSAVSREIKALEDQLRELLFHRINRGLRLTDAGQVLYRAVGEALTLIDEAHERLAASASGPRPATAEQRLVLGHELPLLYQPSRLSASYSWGVGLLGGH